MCCKKDSHYKRQTYIVNIRKAVLLWRYILQIGGLGLEGKKQSGGASRKIKTKHSTRGTIAIYISRLDYKVTSIKRL